MLMMSERLARLAAKYARRLGHTAKAVEDIGGWYTAVRPKRGEPFAAFEFETLRAWAKERRSTPDATH